jgi:hypothetical protein
MLSDDQIPVFDVPGLEKFTKDIVAERIRQLIKFGDQRHPDGTSGHNFARVADQARRDCQKAAQKDTLTWMHIIREEFWEVLAETDSVKLRAELVQLAAVCAAWIYDLDHREKPCYPASGLCALGLSRCGGCCDCVGGCLMEGSAALGQDLVRAAEGIREHAEALPDGDARIPGLLDAVSVLLAAPSRRSR